MSRVHQIQDSRRWRRRHHVRTKIHGTGDRPRLTVQKSLRHVYVQLVDDIQGKSLALVSSVNFPFASAEGKPLSKTARSALVGAKLAARARELGITRVVFDRNHNLYHGRIKAIAEAARKEGLEF
jgi:large subunit ribosomal protein L18